MVAADISGVVEACSWLFAPPGAVPAQWDPSECANRLHGLTDSADAACFVADNDGTIVGFATVYLDLVSIRRGQRSWLNELAVDPAQRSQGIGKQLLDVAREWARDQGATHMALDSSVTRVDAHRFYLREDPDWQAQVFGWDL
jgi:GNAT superfamily N-acetyltransferase